MQLHKFAILVFLGCATFVAGNAQAPPDDDDFAFEGSGMSMEWPISTAAPEPAVRADTTTTTATTSSSRSGGVSWSQPEPDLDGSGSGLRSDDEDYDRFPETPEDEDDYDYQYYDYPEEGDAGSTDNKHDGVISPEKDSSSVGAVPHPVSPTHEEKPAVHSEHRPSLGAGYHPETKPAPAESEEEEEDELEDIFDEDDESDLVLQPEVTLQEFEDVQDELQKVKEKELELERELERQREADRAAGMDGLGTKAVDRNTSFFAQPGILAAVVGGAVVGLLCAILLVMLIVYRMRKKDEGSYPVDEPKRSLTGNSYSKNKDYYA